MIQPESIVTCADNSGAKKLNVIGIPGYSKTRFASVGDIITCSVRGTTGIGTSVKDHEVVKAVIVRTRKEIRRRDGSYIRFDDNAAVVVDKSKNPRATRIFGPVARELRDLGYNKIVSLAPEVW
jgi:large subunit ribosomal protein L14